jgi:hypothetical protein
MLSSLKTLVTFSDFSYTVYAFLVHLLQRSFKIIWLSNLLNMSVSDEGYYRNVSYPLYFLSTFSLLNCLQICCTNSSDLCCIFLFKHNMELGVRVLLLNATFNNILVILWRSVLLVAVTGVPGENHRPVVSHWQTLSHKVVSRTLQQTRFELTTLVVIGTDCLGSCKSNYHTIMTTTVPLSIT